MSRNLKCYMDAKGELAFYEEGSKNELFADNDSTLLRVPAADQTVSDDLTQNETISGNGTIINESRLYKAFSDSQLNINTPAFTVINYKSPNISTYDNSVFSPISGGVQILTDLENVTIIGSVFAEDNNAQRVGLGLSISINGVISTVEATGYTRRVSGHNEDQHVIIETFSTLNSGDVISINSKRNAVASVNTNSIEDKGIFSILGFVPTNANALSGFPSPIITSIDKIVVNSNITLDLCIKGGYFTQTSIVSIPGITVNNIVSIDDDEIIVNITTNNVDGFYDLSVSNDTGTTTFNQQIEIRTSIWVDLRLNGDSFTSGNGAGNNIRHRAGMSLSRDASGMFFTGLNPWQSWVKFELFTWNRGEDKTLQWIFTNPTAAMMIGIGSNATNETSNSQFSQMENEAYFNSATNFWGLYGNNGNIGSAGNQSNNSTIPSNSTFKIKFEEDGGVGSQFTLYLLPSSNESDWDDESNIILNMTVGGSLNPDETVLFPVIIPRSGGTQRFIALKLE